MLVTKFVKFVNFIIHILNTRNRVFTIGALSIAENASASGRRVSAGAMMPLFHNHAVAQVIAHS